MCLAELDSAIDRVVSSCTNDAGANPRDTTAHRRRYDPGIAVGLVLVVVVHDVRVEHREPRPLVVRAAGRVIAYAGIWLMVDEAHVTTFAVLPAYRRRGWSLRTTR